MYACMDGWTDGQMDGWMDELMLVRQCVLLAKKVPVLCRQNCSSAYHRRPQSTPKRNA